ncbi:radical SAM family heme chaperone HemW [Tenuifilum thalassicum]|uniref:Heme chaperone HemW n=1 Tax=Tenuifilum thalassicum TaxID=2590900 RepID=A0A7D4BG34_9BACT|nr:radical SAM family heme chaperone HemW [Tenuifilum thalassicum]QKG81038.1 radical SAM family heme chaperone HemW [Tenuifilum thalassicum]
MSGIYIHVPFCYKKCSYCDFYSVGKGLLNSDFANSIVEEFKLQNKNINDRIVKTIYFGGGTPSLLPVSDIKKIVSSIPKYFTIDSNPEITIEVNPDDVTLPLAKQYLESGINRISIGVQSFNDSELSFLGRRHDAQTAVNAIRTLQDAGFDNISIDLIYGLPNSTLQSWEFSLREAMKLNIQHLSCYHLTYEEGTPLTQKIKKGRIQTLDEEISEKQFQLLSQVTSANGFIHYEVSNLAKPDFFSRHNSGYWLGEEYLGLGPSAHSYNKLKRWWNPASIEAWENLIQSGFEHVESEPIDSKTHFNEMIITRLRTIWGIDYDLLAKDIDSLNSHPIRSQMDKHLKGGRLIIENGKLKIPPKHYFISDSIISDLLIV